MPKIGNDIVDFQLAKTQSNWQRPGFLEKQFTAKEQQEILNSEIPFEKVWLFWSMKEAAYKCYTQKQEKRFFAPQKFECSLLTDAKGTVFYNNQIFYTQSKFDTHFVHTVAKNEKAFYITPKKNMYQGFGSATTVDAEIATKLAALYNLPKNKIEKRKTKNGAPQFYYQNKLLTSSCSITHHGKYGAFAFML